MAKITVCDLCKKPIMDNADYSVCIAHETDKEQTHDGELCTECFETLRNWLLAPAIAALEKPKKSLDDGLREMVAADLAKDEAPVEKPAEPSEVKKLEPPKPIDKNRGKIEEGELNVVKSRFDKKKATQIVAEMKGPCEHHFKSFEDGKFICSDAPFGLKGELAGIRGCGKVLMEAEAI